MVRAKGSRVVPRAGISGASAAKVKAGGSLTAAVIKKGKRVQKQIAGAETVTAISFRGAQLVTAFYNTKGQVSVDLIAERFGMSKSQLADTIGLKREAVYRAARLEAPKTQARATEMLEIIGRVVDWAGGEKQAIAWYRAEPIAAFGGRTAESLVKEGKATAVRDFLDHVARGGFA